MESGFEERKKKHEDKWALDEALRFKAVARRNKLLGRWAAAEMGLSGDAAEVYAKAVVAAEIHGGTFAKLRDDLKAKGLPHSDEDIHRKMDELGSLAAEQVKAGV